MRRRTRSGSAARRRGIAKELPWIPGRSLFPLSALVLLLGTAVWGPFATFVIAYGWWRLVSRVA